ncbi:hypothetical protein CSC18_4651 [Klebsiella aerogenes]|nr:hypothetical protein CSC18_4651 [Klebsiella aerogenes]
MAVAVVSNRLGKVNDRFIVSSISRNPEGSPFANVLPKGWPNVIMRRRT